MDTTRASITMAACASRARYLLQAVITVAVTQLLQSGSGTKAMGTYAQIGGHTRPQASLPACFSIAYIWLDINLICVKLKLAKQSIFRCTWTAHYFASQTVAQRAKEPPLEKHARCTAPGTFGILDI